jgi:cytochrome oxidase Cu insertion factor (SCO1/SenC/PrrC family)
MLKAFDVSAARESITDSTHYLVSHAAQAFLIDTKGRLVAIYPPGIGWDALAADLETFL